MIRSHYILSAELLKDTVHDHNQYPFNLPAVRSLSKLEKLDFHESVTFLIGENGSGKSTLLEAIAAQYGFNPEGGSKNFTFSTRQTHSILEKNIRLAKGYAQPKDWYFLRAESFYNVASNIDDIQEEDSRMLRSYGNVSLHEQSHGESFFSLFSHRLFGNGIYLLDEPEAALSPQGQLALLLRMHELVGQKSQFIIATHSPILLAYPHARILQISEDWFNELPYKETSHFTLYRDFLMNPEYMLDKLDIR